MTAELTPAERQAKIRGIVIEHDRYVDLMAALSLFHRPVRDGLPSVGCLAAVIGDSRSGKSFASDRYRKRFPAVVGTGGMEYPVLYADMPVESAGGPRAVLESLAGALELPITQRMTNPKVINDILRTIVDRKIEHLILDEWDQVFRDGHRALIGFGRGLLRKILNLGTTSVTCIGLPQTYDLLHADEQLRGRGGLPHHVVMPYRWENGDDRQAFRLLCDCFDQQLPFNEQAGLGRTGFAERLHWVSEGNIGRLKVMIEAACALAINDGSARVDLEHFADAYEVRKLPGTPFNPFAHDIAQAPPKKDGGRRAGIVKQGSAAQLFSKRRTRDVTLELEDAV